MTSANASEERAARALYYVATRTAEIRSSAMDISESGNRVIIRALWSGISRGTERLVFEGRVPESEFERMRAPFQEGSFPFPVKYGYSLVGVVDVGPPGLIGRTVFVLHPHQTRFSVPRDAACRCLIAFLRDGRSLRPTWRRHSTPYGTAEPVRETGS